MADPTATPLFNVPFAHAFDAARTNTPTTVPSTMASQSLLPGSNATYVEQDKKHTGVAGVARDILGFLGDFLLTRLKMAPMYGPSQERRKLAIAEQGYGTDPQSTADAISRVSSLDPMEANKLRDQYIDNVRQQASLQSVTEARNARLAQQEEALRIKQEQDRTATLGRTAAYMNRLASLPPEKRPEAYAAARKLWTNSSTVSNDPELQKRLNDFFPENYDENMITSSVSQFVPVAQQWSNALSQDRLDESKRAAGVREEQGQKRIEETGRHNRVTEGQGQQRIGISQQRANTAARGGGSRRPTNVMTYTGSDGYKYAERSDGTTVRSTHTVKPTSTRKSTTGFTVTRH